MSRRSPEGQTELLFADGAAPEMALPHPLADLVADIAQAWGLPLEQDAQVELRDESFDTLRGRLELVEAPDLPLKPTQPLRLRIRGVEFSSTQITAWSLI